MDLDKDCCIETYCVNNNSKIKPNLKKAMLFYKKQIVEVNADLEDILLEYKFESRIPAWKWELFGAILIGDFKKKGNGIDLLEHEVKAYQWRSAPEYQYHKNSWEAKLEEDKKAKHIIFWYKNSFKDLDVFLFRGEDVADIFESWRPDIHQAYETENPRDRCRKHLPRALIEAKGRCILQIRNCVVETKDEELFSEEI